MERVRFKVIHAGRRSFKTEIAKRALVIDAMRNANVSLFFGAPTRAQAKAVAWNDLKLLSRPAWLHTPSETDLTIKLISGSEMHVVGLDKPERVEGRMWHGGVLDEYANMKATAWSENIQPTLMDTGGWCWFVGVPEGRTHYWELSEYARLSGDPEWADYCWKTADVLDPDEVERKRQTMDERTFRQELEGSFESYEGVAYTYHDKDRHQVEKPFDRNLPVIICCDFNLDPCIWLYGQDSPAFTYIKGEVMQRRTDVWKMCKALKDELVKYAGDNARRHPIRIYGDYQHGTSRSLAVVATSSTWKIIADEFAGWNVEIRKKPNPRIVDRVNATNSRMRSADGSVRFGYSRDCRMLAQDYETVDLSMFTSEDQGDRTHACSAVDYAINYEHPVKEQPIWKAA